MRGPADSDLEQFANVTPLREALLDLEWLLDRGYPLPSALTFVGDRHQLTARQRLALRRSAASTEQRRTRAQKQLPLDALAGADVVIDGFNLLITLEVALAGGIIVVGSDGAARDLAGLRGNYHLVDETERAVDLALSALSAARSVRFLLDAPVSNSGRLRALLEARGHRSELHQDVDRELVALPHVVSADAAVLDSCTSWFNVARAVVDTMPNARVVRLDR